MKVKNFEFYYNKKVDGSLEHVINMAKFALVEEGFTVLSQIDMKERIKSMINKDIEDYIVLGACNAELTYEIIVNEIQMGLFLPCNIIIYKEFGNIYVSIIKPSTYNNIINNKEVDKITSLADKKMKRVIDNI